VGAALALAGSGIAVVARAADRRARVPAAGPDAVPAECRVAA